MDGLRASERCSGLRRQRTFAKSALFSEFLSGAAQNEPT
jgi:hypothetical protein